MLYFCIALNIVTHIKEGDLPVFNQVFYQYHEKLYYYVFSKTKSSFCAEEVVQLTFIKLWQYRQNLNETISIDVQLFRIAKTTLIDQLRKINYSEKLLASLQKTSGGFTINKGEGNMRQQELYHQLQTALSEMPPVRRKVFELSRFSGLSYREIADRLSISVKTVENHINRALKHIRHIVPLLVFACLYLLQEKNM